jgi:hypothetical protein
LLRFDLYNCRWFTVARLIGKVLKSIAIIIFLWNFYGRTSPEHVARLPTGFCHKVFYVSRHVIYDSVTNFVFGVVADVDNQILAGKAPAGKADENLITYQNSLR